MFEEKIRNWVKKVICVHNNREEYEMTDTAQMMIDIDKIISDGFDREPIFEENL